MGNNLVQNIRTLNNLDDNWKVLNFDDVIKDVSSGNVKIKKGDLSKKGNLKVVDQGKKLFSGYTINENAVIKSNSPHIVFGDHTRILKYINFPFAIGADGTKILKIKQNVNTFEKYIYYYFLTLNIPNTGYNRHFKYLKSCKIPIPPIATQKKIAAILDEADKLRQLNQQVVNKYQKLTQSLFLEMFGDPVLNPMGWEKKTIEQLARDEKWSIKRGPFGGALKKEIFVEKGYLVYEQYHALNNDFNFARYFITKEKFNELIGFEVKPRDIIISCSGVYLGKLAIIPKNAKKGIINQALLKISLDENIMRNDFFIFHFTNTNFKNKYFSSNRGAGIPNFPPMKEFKSFPFITPPIQLQNEFAAHIKEIEIQKEQAQQALAQSENLFNSLLQRAFKGELV